MHVLCIDHVMNVLHLYFIVITDPHTLQECLSCGYWMCMSVIVGYMYYMYILPKSQTFSVTISLSRKLMRVLRKREK